ncbi:hypothetical protein Pelo_9270 [Pelomyxa schiedti]|nr:hypothetical protein Pelo_9270 [Pelomyxa schiedti]
MQLQMQMPQQSILLPQDRDVPIPTLPAAQLTYPVNHFVPAPPITDSFTRHEVPWNMPLDTQIQGLQEDPSREDVVAFATATTKETSKAIAGAVSPSAIATSTATTTPNPFNPTTTHTRAE